MSENLGDLLLKEAKEKRRDSQKRERATLRGRQVEIRSLSVGERNRLTDESTDRRGKSATLLLAKLIPALWHKSVYDDSGQRVFGSAAVAEAFLEALDPGDGAAEEADKITDIALRLSGMDKEGPKQAVKNSEASGD